MTLCMAAASRENSEFRIVAWADTLIESGWAGANIGYKFDFVAAPYWHCLVAGDPSKDLSGVSR